MDERRDEIRVPVESLPDCLKVISFSTGIFQEHSAVTVDASYNGMGFLGDDLKESDIHVGQDLTVKVMPFNYKLKSKIVYVKFIGETKVRFGVKFHKGPPLDKYHELLSQDIYK
jgi:hypothetical protein